MQNTLKGLEKYTFLKNFKGTECQQQPQQQNMSDLKS